ncbi:hypothetical protein HMPREF9374_3457 [Desmospora sp. 8437]|nr:hypothetical protein HMPREF9374_3457 [Desmospora sp. 8437]
MPVPGVISQYGGYRWGTPFGRYGTPFGGYGGYGGYPAYGGYGGYGSYPGGTVVSRESVDSGIPLTHLRQRNPSVCAKETGRS